MYASPPSVFWFYFAFELVRKSCKLKDESKVLYPLTYSLLIEHMVFFQ